MHKVKKGVPSWTVPRRHKCLTSPSTCPNANGVRCLNMLPSSMVWWMRTLTSYFTPKHDLHLHEYKLHTTGQRRGTAICTVYLCWRNGTNVYLSKLTENVAGYYVASCYVAGNPSISPPPHYIWTWIQLAGRINWEQLPPFFPTTDIAYKETVAAWFSIKIFFLESNLSSPPDS